MATVAIPQPATSTDVLAADDAEIERLEKEIAEAEQRALEEELKTRQYAAEAAAAEEEVRAASGFFPATEEEPDIDISLPSTTAISGQSKSETSISGTDENSSNFPTLNIVDVEIPPMPAELAFLQKEIDQPQLSATTTSPRSATTATVKVVEQVVEKAESSQSLEANEKHSEDLGSYSAPVSSSALIVDSDPIQDAPQRSPQEETPAVSAAIMESPTDLPVVAEEPSEADSAALEQIVQWQSRYAELERKHQALETLHEESQDLEKELEIHVQTLEREAEQNRNELKTRLKELADVQSRMRHLIVEKQDLERRFQDTEQILEKMVQHQDASKTKYEKKLTELSASYETANKRLQQADTEISHLQKEIQKLTTDHVVLKQEIRHLESENEKFQKKHRAEKGYHELFEKKYIDAEERFVLLQQELHDVQTEKAEIVRRLNEEVPHEQILTSMQKLPNFQYMEEQVPKLTPEQRQALLRKFTVEEITSVTHVAPPASIPTVADALASRPMIRQGTLSRMPSVGVPPISGIANLLRQSSTQRTSAVGGVPGVDRPFESQPSFSTLMSPRRPSIAAAVFASPREVLESATLSAAAVKASTNSTSQAAQVPPLPLPQTSQGNKLSMIETGLHITDSSGRPVARVVEDKFSGLVIQPLVMEGGAPVSSRAGGEETEAQGGLSGTNDIAGSRQSRNRASTLTKPIDVDADISDSEVESRTVGRPSYSSTTEAREKLLDDSRYPTYTPPKTMKRGCCSVGACGGRQDGVANESSCIIS